MASPASLLLVEDSPSDVDLLMTAFDEISFAVEVTVFQDGDRAVAGLERLAVGGKRPQLVMLDLNLPRVSGIAVLFRLRTLPAWAGQAVVLYSTSNHPVDRQRCLDAGADDYLVKPADFAGLLDLARHLRDRWLINRN
ncbi:response regulator [Planctomycetota bacterium]|nr:response regulator [Planctomycetota bacterium]